MRKLLFVMNIALFAALGTATILMGIFMAGGFTYADKTSRDYDQAYSADTHWNILGVIVRHIDVNLGGNQIQISMSSRDINIAQQRFIDLGNSLGSMSNGQMTASVSILVINTPLTELTHVTTTTGTTGYAPRPNQIRNLVQNHVNVTSFDHVMSFIRTQADDAPHSVPTNWMGLYNGLLDDVHFSQILFSANRNCTWHTQSFFPELVLIHEFVHGLERIARNMNVEIPSSIDSPRENYGYGTSRQERYRFYYDYMNQNILHNGKRIGLTPQVFVLR